MARKSSELSGLATLSSTRKYTAAMLDSMRNLSPTASNVAWDDQVSATRAYYESNASNYASATVALPLRSRVEAFAREVPFGGSVIDLGCGAGRDLKFMADYGLKPFGIDLSSSLARFASVHSGQPVVVGDVRQLPFADATFDGAWASASLLHLPRNEIPFALAECHRILKPGAMLFTSVKRGQGGEVDEGGRWFTYFLKEEWVRLLRESGFRDITINSDRELRWTRGRRRQHVEWLTSMALAK